MQKIEAATRVFVTSCQTAAGSWCHQEELFRAAFPAADPRLVLCADPALSNFIFITDVRAENSYAALRRHELVRRFPARTFAIFEGDDQPRCVQGVLTSLTATPLNLGRFCSGAYGLNHPDFRNPYIARYAREDTPPSPKYLFSFLGRNCLPLRDRLFALTFSRPDVLVENTSDFDVFTHDHGSMKDRGWRRFAEVLRASKSVLCPRGNGASSIRLFEAMQLGVAPMIISNAWVLPEGPDWSACALRVAESRIGELEAILTAREADAAAIGAHARRAFHDHFDGANYVRFLVAAARRIQSRRVFPERLVQRAFPLVQLGARLRRRATRRRKT
jgi:hypothetical protein